MKLRIIEKERDHATLAGWWEAHAFPAVPAAVLPKLGVMAERDDGTGLAAAFVYQDNSVGVSWLEWLVTNPEATGRESLAAIGAVVEFLANEVKGLGYGVMLTSCRQQGLARIYQRHGFLPTDEGVVHMLRYLGD